MPNLHLYLAALAIFCLAFIIGWEGTTAWFRAKRRAEPRFLRGARQLEAMDFEQALSRLADPPRRDKSGRFVRAG